MPVTQLLNVRSLRELPFELLLWNGGIVPGADIVLMLERSTRLVLEIARILSWRGTKWGRSFIRRAVKARRVDFARGSPGKERLDRILAFQ